MDLSEASVIRPGGTGRHRGARKRSGPLAGVLAAFLALVAGVAVFVCGDGAAPASAASAACRHASGPFRVVGNKVYGKTGRFIPYGISIVGLGSPSWASREGADDAQIRAAASYWCANVVRLQVYEPDLVSTSGVVNHRMLADLEDQVITARSLGLIVAINCQTEGIGIHRQIMPGKETRKFWHVMAGLYGHSPSVIFDLFNEPRRVQFPSEQRTWHFWKYGGRFAGTRYMGMQTLARYVRSLGARNLFWVEGPHTATSLQLLRSYPVTKAGPVEYSVNHPGSVKMPRTVAFWDARFGNMSRYFPITDTEWSNYATATRSCWRDAPVTVPRWLRFLAAHGMGMTAWSLSPGVMLRSRSLNDPTRIGRGWGCRDGIDQGAGHQEMAWFELHNR